VRRLIVLALLTVLAGCGGSTASDAKQVRAMLAVLARATAQKDYRTLCTRVLAPQLISQLEQLKLPCEVALARGLGNVVQPQLAVRSIRVKGKTALAQVHTSAANQRASDDTVALVKLRGGWRVASLATR
jgi:hypothetical protein